MDCHFKISAAIQTFNKKTFNFQGVEPLVEIKETTYEPEYDISIQPKQNIQYKEHNNYIEEVKETTYEPEYDTSKQPKQNIQYKEHDKYKDEIKEITYEPEYDISIQPEQKNVYKDVPEYDLSINEKPKKVIYKNIQVNKIHDYEDDYEPGLMMKIIFK